MRTVFLLWADLAVIVPTLLLSLALALAVLRRRRERAASTKAGPAIHLVRPVCGREEAADAKNLSLLRQDYEPLEVAFVAESALDPGLEDARRICAEEERGTCLTAHDERAVAGKARNMMAGWRSSTSEFVGFCDSDISLSPDAIGHCMTSLSETHASAVFAPCLFDAEGPWGRLAMQVATVDKYALAQAGAALGLVPCMEGGLMLVSRSALEAAGGIEIITETLADDLRIGRALRAHGFRLAISGSPVLHRSPPEGATIWARRYLRWAICRRTEAPGLQLLNLALNPILIPLVIAMTCSSASTWGLLAIGIVWRIAYSHLASRLLLEPHGVRLGAWCCARPITELLDAAFIGMAFVTRSVTWRECTYDIDHRGRVTRAERGAQTAPLVLGRAP